MSDIPKPASRSRVFKRFWKPAAVTGAGGTAAAIWFDEILLYAEEILALIFLPLMAGMIYLLDNSIFRSRMPEREDWIRPDNRGEQK